MMLYLDWLDYAERLIGPADWTDAASVAALFGKAQALLPSELLLLPVARIVAAHAAAKPAGMRAVLGGAALRAMLAETLARLAGATGPALLGLQLPAPADLAVAVAVVAGQAPPAVDADFADDAAVYVADFLRAFSVSPIAVLLLGDGGFPEFDAPILRVAAHYDWVVMRPAAVRSVVVPADMRPEDALALVAGLRATAEGAA